MPGGMKSALRATALREETPREWAEKYYGSEPKSVWHTMSEEDKNARAESGYAKYRAMEDKRKRSEAARSRAYDRKTAELAKTQAEMAERERTDRRF